MKIYGFYHVLLKNHWQEIVQEQLDCLIKSELYKNAEQIFVGCVGEQSDYLKLCEILNPFEKFSVSYFSEDILQYEFPTLKLLYLVCDLSADNFALFYIHTKGASFDKSNQKGYEGGNYWRGYMNFYTIANWKNALHEIEMGYDVVGVKLRKANEPPAKKLHFSGNFFWTHSDYVKKLPPIDSLDKTNRYNAEFWHGMANPKTFSMCQDWVDYNSKGVWKDPPMVEKRNIVHTLCWNTYDQVELAVTDLYKRNDRKDFIHVLVDLGFPLEKGNEIPADIEFSKETNSLRLKNLADQCGSIYFKCENIGVSQNWTQVAKFMGITENDILLCADPDERVQTDGWVKALCDVMRYNKRYGWLSLYMPEYSSILNEKNTIPYKYWDIRVYQIIGNLNWAQGAMSGKLIVKMNGEIPHPQHYEIYGGLESATRKEMSKHNMTWGIVPDFIVQHTNEVPLLREWKDLIIHDIKKFGQITFERFLQMKRSGIL